MFQPNPLKVGELRKFIFRNCTAVRDIQNFEKFQDLKSMIFSKFRLSPASWTVYGNNFAYPSKFEKLRLKSGKIKHLS